MRSIPGRVQSGELLPAARTNTPRALDAHPPLSRPATPSAHQLRASHELSPYHLSSHLVKFVQFFSFCFCFFLGLPLAIRKQTSGSPPDLIDPSFTFHPPFPKTPVIPTVHYPPNIFSLLLSLLFGLTRPSSGLYCILASTRESVRDFRAASRSRAKVEIEKIEKKDQCDKPCHDAFTNAARTKM